MKKIFLATINTMKDKISKVFFGAALAVNLVMHNTKTAYAAVGPVLTKTGIAEIDNPVGKLIGLVLGLVSAYGLIVLGKNLMEFFSALPERDTSSMKQAGLGAVSGFGIAAIGGVLSFLGFTW